MSEDTNPQIDPESGRPMGDVAQFTRRKLTPGHWALAFLLAVVITAVGFGVLALVLWVGAIIFR
jgi:hypothetical protein